MLSLDQEKAFDRVDWSFLQSTLYALGIGQSFVGWVDLFYYNPCSAVSVNGYIVIKLYCRARIVPGWLTAWKYLVL